MAKITTQEISISKVANELTTYIPAITNIETQLNELKSSTQADLNRAINEVKDDFSKDIIGVDTKIETKSNFLCEYINSGISESTQYADKLYNLSADALDHEISSLRRLMIELIGISYISIIVAALAIVKIIL